MQKTQTSRIKLANEQKSGEEEDDEEEYRTKSRTSHAWGEQ